MEDLTFECGEDVQAFSLSSFSRTSSSLQAASYIGNGQEERTEDVMGDLSWHLDAEQQNVSAGLGYQQKICCLVSESPSEIHI